MEILKKKKLFFIHFGCVIIFFNWIEAYLKPKSFPSSIIGVDNILLYIVICYHPIRTTTTTDISLNGIINV